MSDKYDFRNGIKSETVTLGGSIVTLASKMSGTKFTAGVTRIMVQNLDATEDMFISLAPTTDVGDKPGATTDMSKIGAGQYLVLAYPISTLNRLYVCGHDATHAAHVWQDGMTV